VTCALFIGDFRRIEPIHSATKLFFKTCLVLFRAVFNFRDTRRREDRTSWMGIEFGGSYRLVSRAPNRYE
jgi:hypothetical protein